MNQITAARNIRDVINLIKSSNSNNLKQPISEESFERIQTEIDLCIIDLPEERELVQKFLNQKKKIIENYNNLIITQQNLLTYETFLTVIKTFGILLPKLIEKIETIVNDSINLNKDIKKLLDLNKNNKIILNKEKISGIVDKYNKNNILFDSGEELKKMYKKSESIIEQLKEIVENNFEIKFNFEISEDFFEKDGKKYEENLDEENLEDKNYKNYKNNKFIDIYELNSLFFNIEIHNFLEEKIIKKVSFLGQSL